MSKSLTEELLEAEVRRGRERLETFAAAVREQANRTREIKIDLHNTGDFPVSLRVEKVGSALRDALSAAGRP